VPSNTSKGDQELIELQRALLTGPTTGVPAAGGDPEVRKTYRARRVAQREAYGQFVANSEIYDPDGSALIFAAGQPVPVEHVERLELEAMGLVNRVASPELARKGLRHDNAKDAEPVTEPAGNDGGGDAADGSDSTSGKRAAAKK
jgi:hypothetical protein